METVSIFGPLQEGWAYVQDRTGKTFAFLREQRNNLELFERIAQVVVACLHLAGKATHFAAFHTTLSAGSMHSFYKFFQRPYLYLYPYSEEQIDAEFLHRALQNGGVNPDLTRRFTKTLERMKKEDVAFVSREEFAEAIESALDIENVDPQHVRLKKKSLPERILSVFDFFIQGETALFCLNEWKLLSTASLAERVSSISWLGGIKEWSLLPHLKKLSFAAAGFKLYESCRRVHEGKTQAVETIQLIWDGVAAFFDSLYFGAQYLQLTSFPQFSASWIHGLSLVSDLVGIARILGRRPTPYLSGPIVAV